MKDKFKRISAIVAVVILVVLYLLVLLFAVINVANWQRMFFAALGATIVVPILLWINIFLYDRTIGNRKVSDGDEEITHGKSSENK